MARILSQTLLRETQTLVRDRPPASHLLGGRPCSPLLPPRSRLISVRWRSGRPHKFVHVFEVELEATADGGASPSAAAAARGEAAARWLESVIHGILERQAAPDWLPFVPGASYWVPPRRRSEGLAELLGRMSDPMSDEEVMSLTTMRGWPCAQHLVGDMAWHLDYKSTEGSMPSDDEDR
ncbi:hypothetical protein Taro_018432 [Colocasia esculenta]|uniref:Uncharacterized protein n=1 Tax=Colocasia esculenta TaxID=4460 RepID=A0A843UIQ0_COLES|nr:hypothetical protein [Colocasia esculenta]